MQSKLPLSVQSFRVEFPDVWQAFTQLCDEWRRAGTLDV